MPALGETLEEVGEGSALFIAKIQHMFIVEHMLLCLPE